MKYAEVIIPLPLSGSFTYRIPESMISRIKNYCRVVVPFGKKHYYTGIVTALHERVPVQPFEVKEILVLLDEKPIIRETQLRLWQWLSSYYLCTSGEVYRAALPSGLKPESETVVAINSEFEASERLKPGEQKILDLLSSLLKQSVSELERQSGLKNVLTIIHSLLEKGAVYVNESLKTGFKPKTETYLCLSKTIKTEKEIEKALHSLRRAKQQEKLFLSYLELSGIKHHPVSKKRLLKHSGINAPVLKGLIEKKLLVIDEQTVSRLVSQDIHVIEEITLSKAQNKAYDDIRQSFESKNITLLHVPVSREKTDVYTRLIADVFLKRKQVLYLLPEIAVTARMTERLRNIFGGQLLVYHSGISDNERVEIWNKLLNTEEPLVVLGTRSSVFLPFARLGLVIIDEEHDSSYKQHDPAPRYHAGNVAMVMATHHQAKVLLGTATPSLETYFAARKGKYGFVTLDNGDKGGPCFDIALVNVRELRRKKQMKNTLFSPLLRQKIEKALTEKEQIVLFQNRRGFSPMIVCDNCGAIPHCRDCDVSLTYHKKMFRLACHYCGYSIPLPSECPQCKSKNIKMQGFGTEKIEEEAKELFPSAVVKRLDLDTARTRKASSTILSDFKEEKIQILIGTRMVMKGIDFTNVSVVGVMSADGLMNIPDFRAYERTFQTIMQINSNAQKRKQGSIIVQTSQSDNPLLQMAKQGDYAGMAATQLKERHLFKYPPYTRLIMIVFRSRSETVLDSLVSRYADRLKKHFGEDVSNPIYPPVTRIQTLFIRKIMLKTDLSKPVFKTRAILEKMRAEMFEEPASKKVLLHYDVDPQ